MVTLAELGERLIRALGVSGSARKGGNSETLLEAVLRGAASVDVEGGVSTEIVRANDLDFRGCQGCDACQKAARCRLRDLDEIHAKLRDSDVWVFSAPIYYDGVSGQMKLFFDRLRPFSVSKLPGRRAGLIVVAYEDKEREDYARHARVLAGYLSWFGDFRPAEVLCGSRLAGPKDAASRPEILARAEEMGRRLVRELL